MGEREQVLRTIFLLQSYYVLLLHIFIIIICLVVGKGLTFYTK